MLWLVWIGTSLASVVALAGRWSWFAELFTHFRLYYLLAQGLVVVAFLNTRRYGWCVLTLALAAPNAWYLGPYLLPAVTGAAWGAGTPERPQLVAINLNYHNDQHGLLIEYLEELQPDVIVMAEYTGQWDDALSGALAAWPYRVRRPRVDPFGIAVYSRVAPRETEWLDLGTPGAENLRLRVQLAGRDLDLYAVHLYPPSSKSGAAQRDRQLVALGRRVARSPRPVLLAGDLNLTPFSPWFQALLSSSGLADARRPQGLQITWPAAPLPVWIPIDHCLAAPAAGVRDVRTGPAVGSDHYPLEITLAPVG